jgi:hypothetical protein
MTCPDDPLTELAKGAAQLHEFFASLVQAGFTEAQALYLTGRALSAQAGGTPSGD